MPKFTTEQIISELDAVDGRFAALIYYGNAEVDRRVASTRNTGAPVRFDDEKHRKDRERKRK